jgi:hypothetical protein
MTAAGFEPRKNNDWRRDEWLASDREPAWARIGGVDGLAPKT